MKRITNSWRGVSGTFVKRYGLMVLLSVLALGQAQSLPREVRARILEAVVQVIPLDEEAGELVDWSGSGTVISPNGHILTNFHVIGDPDSRRHHEWHAILVTRPNAADQPPQHMYWARYVSSDSTSDLALLKIVEFADEEPIPEAFTFTAVPVGDSNDLLPGDLITVVGYPGISGSTITFTSGLMSGWLGEDFRSGGKQWIKTDAKIARGNSGGAAFNDRGELIGVPTAGIHQLEASLYEEQLYVRPISLAWALIGPSVPTVLRASGTPTTVTPGADTALPTSGAQASGSYGTVDIGGSRSGVIAAKPADQSLVYHTYSVTVPEGLAELTLRLDGGGKDIDIAIKAGAEITSYDDVDYLDISPETNPSHTLTDPSAGTLYIDVLNLLSEPIAYTLSVEASPRSPPPLTAGTTSSTMVGAVAMGQTATGQLAGLDGSISYHTYVVEVPAGTTQLLIRMEADADLDLAAKFGSELASYRDRDNGGDWDYRDNSPASSADLLIDNPREGRWYIDVYNALQSTVTSRYSLSVEAREAGATHDAAPSPSTPPVIPAPVTPPPPPATPASPAGSTPTRHFFLGTGEEVHNTTSPQVEVDNTGTLHMVYPAHAIGGAFYATCPADCSGQEQVEVVAFETSGTVYNAMLALDQGGRPHVLLSSYDKIYYATCEGNCAQRSAWTQSVVLEHASDREVTGEAFALDPQGRPRFIMHAYRAMMGIGQTQPVTFYVTCDANCHAAGSWSAHKISDQIWQESTLLFTAEGQARLATIASVDGVGDIAGYAECDADCANEESWPTIGLESAFSNRWVEEIDPAISLALTRSGDPRLLILGQDEAGNRRLTYAFCTAPCGGEDHAGRWSNYYLNTSDAIGAGLDLALDNQDRPRFAYTASYNILLAYCDTACDTLEGVWDLAKVEMSGDIPADTIFPYWNCSVSAWFLRRPSLAIGVDGWPRVGYEAMDISGPYGVPDPNHPECKTGADMVLTRFAQLGAYLK